MKTYAIAIVATAARVFFSFFKTFVIIAKLFEYRKNFKALKTLNARKSLNNFNSLNPLFKIVKEGKIETRSIIAIGVIG